MFTNVSGKFITVKSYKSSSPILEADDVGDSRYADISLPSMGPAEKFISETIPPVPGDTSSKSRVVLFLEEYFGKYWCVTLFLILLLIYFYRIKK